MRSPPFPEELGYLWQIYLRLSARRSVGWGRSPLSWADIDAFCRLTGTRLVPWEIKIIEMLDDLSFKDVKKEEGE